MAKQAAVESLSPGAGAIPPPPAASPPAAVAELSPVIYFCGLQRNGHGQYAVVTGTLQDGKVLNAKIDKISQDLGNAAEELRSEFQKMCGTIP